MAFRRLVPLTEVERAMKVQEIILRGASRALKWHEAAEILGISERQLRRWRERYEEHGYDGLFDRRKQQPSPRRIPMEVVEQVLQLYREEYQGYNVRHFHEELQEEHDIEVSYTWTKLLLQEAGLVKKAKKRGQYRRRRERRPLPGMLLHLDGSFHRWFEHPRDERQALLAVLDDATGECLSAHFFKEEGTSEVLTVVSRVVEEHGTFISLYTDRASHFVYTPKSGGRPDRSKPTQVEQVLDELGIELIVAWSPEARGRSERAWRTMQGRLPNELRRAGITTYEEANRYLEHIFRPKFNRKFTVAPKEEGTAFVRVVGVDLDRVFTTRHQRIVNPDNTISFENRVLQLPKVTGVATLRKRKVEVREHLDGAVSILLGRRLVASFPPELDTLAGVERAHG